MDTRFWPLYGLRLTTPRLELRLPDLHDLDALAAVAADGVHDPDRMPFSVPWTDAEPEARGRATYQHVLSTIAGWTPADWNLSLVVLHQDKVVGRMDLMAKEFATTREVLTGSWLGLAHQGQGIGTEMRAAALHLAFAGLDARSATSGALSDNAQSLGVSRKLGYRDDGTETLSVRGEAVTLQRLRIDRADWEARRAVDVTVSGLEGCLAQFTG
ncbi:GNAT family protein [Streptomyces sp. NPDC050738]|uniref:GNAT family N-acetyltransferase n=1 Tax=Streptomyces sp. NPDC050738 TaxID=3154744 RepID=UPI00343B7921